MKAMTCREFDEVVLGFVRMELLDVTLREAALDHAAGCANCAERMSDAIALAEASEATHVIYQGQETPRAVEAVLLSAFRNHHRRAAWRRTFEWSAIGAVAALMLALVWTASASWRGPSAPAPRKDVSTQSDAPVYAKATKIAQPPEILPVADIEDVNAATGETLAAENFVPLPYADAIGPEDLGMVVRVELTRASLAELGYPASDTLNPDDDLISADILVGEDGWPRAVRVVQ